MVKTLEDESSFVRAEQVHVLYQQAPTAIVTGMSVSALLFIFAWTVADRLLLSAWFAAILAISLSRLWLIRAFHRLEPDDRVASVWERRFNLGALVSGSAWGLLTFVMDLSWPLPYQAMIFVTLLGIGSGALASNGLLTRTYMRFTVPLIAPLVVVLSQVGDGAYVGMSVLVGLYLTVLYYASSGYQANLEASLRLQYRNAVLLDSVSRVNAGLEAEISERKEAEAALSREKEKAEITLHSIADAVITTDLEGRVSYLNPVAEKLTGWHLDEACGLSLDEVFRIEPLLDEFSVGIPEQDIPAGSGQCLLRDRGGGLSPITHTRAPIREPEGNVLGSVVVFQDITPLRDMARELAYRASHDALTGLINRHEFELMLGGLLDSVAREPERHVLLYLDLDQFKVVNDTCGHPAGDALLRELGNLLLKKLSRSDTMARLGGDEFGLLLRNCPLEVGVKIAEKLRRAVKEFRFSWEGKSFEIGASIGVVPVDRDVRSVEELLSNADMACYTAKDLGRNRVHVYEPRDEEVARRQGEMQWISRVYRALEEDRLLLYYQEIAQINGPDDAPGHFEVLMRMRDEQGQLVPPNAFLPAAERYNLMPTLDRWVVAQALAWYREYGNHGVVCSINLSGTSLNDDGLLTYIRESFESTGVRPDCICFEITETAAVANLGAASLLIQELRNLGCQFALDDFGSGLSSFAYLKNLPVDFIKIDGEFVRDVVADPIDRAMVAAINTVGQVMGKQTIAEYVESEEILQVLGEIGVNFAQGYTVGRPTPLQGELELVGRRVTGPMEVVARL